LEERLKQHTAGMTESIEKYIMFGSFGGDRIGVS
jgi:hypothetical protein